jgi:GNAT superfamily N-acetyltransferase
MNLTFRKAEREDVTGIVQLLADDKLGALREDYQQPLPNQYYEAFERIDKDENQELIIVEDEETNLIGTLQLSFIQYLTYKGGLRAQIEAVRIRKDLRNKGVGHDLFQWAINRSKERGAHLLQLTTDKQRHEALNFYKDLGFVASHEGMKLYLNEYKSTAKY